MSHLVATPGPDTARKRILDAAAYLLKHQGLSRTKLSQIAERAGMLAPSLYYHFESRDKLVEEIMFEGIYRNTRYIMSQVEGLGANASSLERLEAAILAHVQFLLTGDDFSAAVGRVFDDLPDDLRIRVIAAYSSFENYWRDLIVAAHSGIDQPAINPSVARNFLTAMLKSIQYWYRPGKLTPEQIAWQARDLFLYGFLKRSDENVIPIAKAEKKR